MVMGSNLDREWVVILGTQEAELGESLRQSVGEQRNTHFPNFKQGFQVRGSCSSVCVCV